VDITVFIGHPDPKRDTDSSNRIVNLPCYVNKVYIYPTFDPKRAIVEGEKYTNSFDSVSTDDYVFFYKDKLTVQPEVILKTLSIAQGDKYDIRKVEETNKYLNTIGLFKLINIRFSNPQMTDTVTFVNCIMQLTPFMIQAYQVEADASNYGNNYEAALNLSYQHRNIFRGAEMLNLKFTGAMQIVSDANDENARKIRFNSYEYGVEAKIDFPKFIMPIKSDNFYKKYFPKTAVGGAYNYQNQPNYIREMIKGNFGYLWNVNQQISNILTPLEVNSVRFPEIDSAFLKNNSFRIKDFDNYFITSSWYTVIYTNQRSKSIANYIYLRSTIEFAGNLLITGYILSGKDKADNSYWFDNQTRIAQYARSDIDFRYYNVLNQNHRMVYRITTGFGFPYGNIQSMPFVKQYSAGGASDIRAWQHGRLGPGTFSDTTWFPNQTSNLKIIANLEYRFHIIWMLEGALFADVGNIWSTSKIEERDEAKFKFNQFYNQIAIGSGVGIRADLSFLILRFDLALKIRDPAFLEHNGFILNNRKLTKNDYTIHIGIGYPF